MPKGLKRLGWVFALGLTVLSSGCGAMVVQGVGEALARTAAEGVAIEVAAGAACKAAEPKGEVGEAACPQPKAEPAPTAKEIAPAQ